MLAEQEPESPRATNRYSRVGTVLDRVKELNSLPRQLGTRGRAALLPEAYTLAKEMETECRNLLHEITRLEEALAQDLARRKEKPV